MIKVATVYISNSTSNNGSSDQSSSDSNQPASGTSIETVNKIETPRLYKVILLNDDFTPMDFVILVLQRFFAKPNEEAQKIMLDVHKKGSGIAGVFTLEVAEMKVMQVNQFARMQKHPLKCTLEAES